jgi:hypothetical protein
MILCSVDWGVAVVRDELLNMELIHIASYTEVTKTHSWWA